jgi:3-hydroxymyristoyl/3-hydroxydecanoyl-(acyl carrier protein) dehydratase
MPDTLLFTERFFFAPSDPLFLDHFPGHAVIPGSLLLGCFERAVRGHRDFNAGGNLKLKICTNARFLNFGRPGWIDVEIARGEERQGEVVFSCLAMQEGERLCTARMHFADDITSR